MGNTRSTLAAFVMLVLPLNAKASKIENDQIIEAAKALGAKDPHLVLAIVERESRGSAKAVYPIRAPSSYGLMQLKYQTAKAMGFVGPVTELYEWRKNLQYGVRYLDYQLDRYDGDIRKAVSAYNAGHAKYRKDRKGFINQSYVDYVLQAYARYRSIYITPAGLAWET